MEKILVDDRKNFAFCNAKASLEIEDQTLPKGGEELILRRVKGNISQEEFLNEALEIAKSE